MRAFPPTTYDAVMRVIPRMLCCVLIAGCVGSIRKSQNEGSIDSPRETVVPQSVGGTQLAIAARVFPMSQVEYANTVQALTGLAVSEEFTLFEDPKVQGFSSGLGTAITLGAQDQLQAISEAAAESVIENADTYFQCDLSAVTSECVGHFIDSFGRLAFRRPLSDVQRQDYFELYSSLEAEPLEGVRAVIEAMLQSPYFIYRREVGDAANGSLDPYALVETLAFTLWQEAPDAALLDRAAAGELNVNENEALASLVTEMMQDARSERFFQSFFFQHFGIPDNLEVDSAKFPEFTESLYEAMLQETRLGIRSMWLNGDMTVQKALSGTKSFVNDELAAFYGVEGVSGPAFVETDLSSVGRIGILSHASWLAPRSSANLASPVQRGLWIREHLLCQHIESPPPDVDDTIKEPESGAPTSERALFDNHFKPSTCVGCHRYMDPLGLPFGRFDAIGRSRELDTYGSTIDTSGTIILPGNEDVAVVDHVELMQRLLEVDDVDRCFSKTMLQAVSGVYVDMPRNSVMTGGDLKAYVAKVLSDKNFYVRSEGVQP